MVLLVEDEEQDMQIGNLVCEDIKVSFRITITTTGHNENIIISPN